MYFVHVTYEAERPRTREEQLAYNARTGALAAGLRDLRTSLTATAGRTLSFIPKGRGIRTLSAARPPAQLSSVQCPPVQRPPVQCPPEPGPTPAQSESRGPTASRELVGSLPGSGQD
jgi:hypothetical protein